MIMEKCNIAYLVSLKGDESNHYNSNCVLCQRCWLMCTAYGEYKQQEHAKTWNVKHRKDFFYSTQSSYISKEYSFTKV
jgi:Fe-S-cluster-containing hydrogenase component 2